jgi:16S rRNA (cytidine1402-2'-O)-methyltransferase
MRMAGMLYIVGTPIGNLGDLSERAKQTLAEADFIAAEDTRVTAKLLNHFGIKKPLVSYHEHNRAEKGPDLLDRMLAGERCALVTDAGMPAISDPGVDLVRLCRENGVPIATVPGPTALATALAYSGMDVARFSFEGFLTVNKPKRRQHLEELKTERKTMVFYEAPHKLAATLADLYATLGERRVAVIKELTKIHESCMITTLSQAAADYADTKLRGEYVLIVEAKTAAELAAEQPPADPEALARTYMAEGMSLNEAAKRAAKETGAKKSDIYKVLTQTS